MSNLDPCTDQSLEMIQFQTLEEEYQAPIQTWILRVLIGLKGYRAFGTLCGLGLDTEAIFHTLELDHLNDNEVKQPQILAAFRERYDKIMEDSSPEIDGSLKRNLFWLAERLNLSDTEQRILAFLVLANNITALSETLGSLGDMDLGRAERALALILDLPLDSVSAAFQPDATLIATGLMRFAHHINSPLPGKLKIMGRLNSLLLQEHSTPSALFRHFFHESAPPHLARDAYPHATEDIMLIQGYLTEALQQQHSGVNVLIYGPPGTGKTELTRVLAHVLGVILYEVAMADRIGQPLPRHARFSSYQMTQHLLANQSNGIILFDEIEDVFPRREFSLFGISGEEAPGKAWINDLLEHNPVPSFWLTNHIEQIDPAYLRRFDYVLELKQPPRTVRRRILEQYLSPYPVRPQWIERAAHAEALTPAHVERAARVVHHLGIESTASVETAMDRILGNNLAAIGEHYSRAGFEPTESMAYSLEYLNPDEDLEEIAAGLCRSGRGRLCLYGPPGSGKTAFGRYLADRLDRPCVQKQLSDLLGPYVGQTERAIADAFAEAARQSAVLIIDEIDSLLRQRNIGDRSWEISQVNEFLTQMESYDGILVASTNMMDGLDSAAMRRFDLKIQFNYLKPNQIVRLLADLAVDGEQVREDDEMLSRRVSQLKTVTPGDFKTVMRNLSFRGRTCTRWALVEGLEKEASHKQESPVHSVGFTRD